MLSGVSWVSGPAALLLLAGFFDCGGGGGAVDPSESPVNKGAWQSERILYADENRGALITVRDDGTERQTLIQLDGVACPNISADGSRIIANMLETNELILIRKTGDNSVFSGLSGGDLGTSSLGPDGLSVVFHEYTGDAGGSCPSSQLVSASTNGTNIEAVEAAGSEGTCARWPEIDHDGDLYSYEREDPGTGMREICMLTAGDLSDAGCLPITELTGPRAWSPGGEMLIGNDFRTWRTGDGVETSSPLDELKELMPPAGENDLREKIEGHLAGMGAALLPGVRAPLSLDWGADDRIVFDAAADGPDGSGVHVFIYDLRNDTLEHVLGPLPAAGADENAVTHVCPRWIP